MDSSVLLCEEKQFSFKADGELKNSFAWKQNKNDMVAVSKNVIALNKSARENFGSPAKYVQ